MIAGLIPRARNQRGGLLGLWAYKQTETIHTGFSGPGTGQHYSNFVSSFNEHVDQLLAEEAGP